MQPEQISKLLVTEAWTGAPDERDPMYFRTWQRVSIALQRAVRQWTLKIFSRDVARFEDRDAAYQLIVYAACRPFYGRPRTEFTFDIADPEAFPAVSRSIGCALRRTLAPVEQLLRIAGLEELSRRYHPVWYQDVMGVVMKRPRRLAVLLAAEARLIDAAIDLGTRREVACEHRYLRIAGNVLHNFHGVDMRELIPRVLEETTRILGEHRAVDGLDHLIDAGVFNDDDARTARGPNPWIARDENRHHWRSDGRGQMADAGIVSDVHAGG